jgi:hypothetical protein
MSCCGKNRTRSSLGPRASLPRAAAGTVAMPTQGSLAARPGSGLLVEYRGPGRFVTRGPATGKTYEFAGSGARTLLDARDRDLIRNARVLQLVNDRRL